jgi:hypothetical protein
MIQGSDWVGRQYTRYPTEAGAGAPSTILLKLNGIIGLDPSIRPIP